MKTSSKVITVISVIAVITAIVVSIKFLNKNKEVPKLNNKNKQPTSSDLIKYKKNSRGTRNHNPLNIEYNKNNKWRGMVSNDGRFCIFENDVYGFRAAARILKSYERRGITRVSDIIKHWAPESENNVDAYVSAVGAISGLGGNAIINSNDKPNTANLLKAMAKVETGNDYALSVVQSGVAAA